MVLFFSEQLGPSAFSAPIQRAINLPVYDINSLVEYAYYAVCRKDY